MPQNKIKMSAPLSHTQNIKGSREIYISGVRAKRNAKLLPHLYLPADPEPVDHLATFRDQAHCCDASNSVASCSPTQADRPGKKPPLVFNKVWGYFSPPVIPLLLHIGSAVKAIDCEPAPQTRKWERRTQGRELLAAGDLCVCFFL